MFIIVPSKLFGGYEKRSLIATVILSGVFVALLESVHEVHEGLQSRLSIMRMEASLTKVSAVRVRFSKSFARRRQRLSQANVRSTIQRLGRTSKPLA